MYDHTFSELANQTVSLAIEHGHKSSSAICVGMYELTYSLYHPRGVKFSNSSIYDYKSQNLCIYSAAVHNEAYKIEHYVVKNEQCEQFQFSDDFYI